MKALILDERREDRATCHLCRISLEDYITALPSDFDNYDIQRGIVSNVYLDRLVDTVLQQRHIPPIVLVVEDSYFTKTRETLDINSYKILDGLQRTFRLQAIHKTIAFALDLKDKPSELLSSGKFNFSRAFSSPMREIHSSTEVLRQVLEALHTNGALQLSKSYKLNNQWFEVWTGLSHDEQIRKMLTLNAGHKPVSPRHQIELLFLNLLPVLRKQGGTKFSLVREKTVSATRFSKARDVGDFHFAHLISSLLSMHKGIPIGISTDLIKQIQDDDSGLDPNSELSSEAFIKVFVSFLSDLDGLLSKAFPKDSIGVLWMGREISLAGLFGAVGAIAQKNEQTYTEVLGTLWGTLKDNPALLNLYGFEHARNKVDLSKVNLGKVNRTAVYLGIQDFMAQTPTKPIDWILHFRLLDNE